MTTPKPRFREQDHTMLVPGKFFNKSPKNTLTSIVGVICPMVFSSFHFLTWNVNFPTPEERHLWDMATGAVTGSGLGGVLLLLILQRLHFILQKLHFRRRQNVLLHVIIFASPSTIYTLASGFLIVESLWQLAFLDPPSYQLLSWSNYWPCIY